ncbi:MAG: SRPBCC family protein [Armatimonadota bacterium]|nr:SRPBCC family protein [Armatimonadota bacterium]
MDGLPLASTTDKIINPPSFKGTIPVPTLQSSRDIAADIDTVYALARRVEDFPNYMPDVRSIKLLEQSPDGSRTVTEWVGIVEQFNQTVRWTEEDIWDHTAHTCQFKQIKGDYSAYSGEWRFIEIPSGTRFESTLHFEYNIPLIGALIQGIIARLMKTNLENTLKAIAEQAEAKVKSHVDAGTPDAR